MSRRNRGGALDAEVQNLRARITQLAADEAGAADIAAVYTSVPVFANIIAASGFMPGTGGKLLAAMSVQCVNSGRIQFSANLTIGTSAPDTPVVAAFLVPDLTAITGGTAVPNTPGGRAIVGTPSSVTPALSPALTFASAAGATFVNLGENTASLVIANTIVQGDVEEGVLTGIVLSATSNSPTTTWLVIGNLTAIELP